MFGLDFGYLTTTCLAVLTVITFFYWYSMRNHDFWKNRGVPYIKISPFYLALKEIGKKHLHDIEQERYNEYGKMYGYFEFNRPLLSVADPDLIRDILVKDFQTFNSRRMFTTGNEIFDKMVSVMKGDEDWKRIRSIITPTFTTGKIKKMMSILKDCSCTVVKNFKELSAKGQYIDAKRLYGAYTMDVIASSAFSTKIDSHNDPNNRFVQNASIVFNQTVSWRLIVLFMFPFLTKFFKIDFFPGEVMEFFKQITIEIMEERKRTGQTRNDFLQLLMDTAKEVDEEPEEKGGDIASNYGVQEDINPHILKSVTSKKLSMDELVSQCVIFFIGGYDTTASTLSFATYFLAVNPEVQAKARDEVDQAIKEADGELTNEGIQKMKYLDNVISETLRMYPPLIRNERTVDAPYKLGDTGISLPKGMVVSMPIYAIHRDPKYFPDPDKFDPERFNPEERAKRHPYVYLPFGAGPRNCVAMRFALMEVKVCVAHVVANFIIKTCPETKVPLDFAYGMGILQPRGIILEMETRTDSPLLK